MRILSYNIRDGGAGRLDALAHVVSETDADAVAVLEATAESTAALAARLRAVAAFGEGNSVFPCHVAWLSRRPILSSRNHRLPALAKTLLEIEVDGLRLFAAHLASRHEEAAHPRDREVHAICDVLRATAGPHLLVGDFNALQPDDVIGLPPPGVQPRGDALPGAARLVLRPLADAGYVDCYRALHPDEPGWTYPAEAPWLRLDYAFTPFDAASGLRTCEVVGHAATARASDHLPLLVELG